jgi:hypothetical protein
MQALDLVGGQPFGLQSWPHRLQNLPLIVEPGLIETAGSGGRSPSARSGFTAAFVGFVGLAIRREEPARKMRLRSDQLAPAVDQRRGVIFANERAEALKADAILIRKTYRRLQLAQLRPGDRATWP